MASRLARTQAFTLTELAIVISIIAMILAVAVPSMTGFVKGTRVNVTRTKLLAIADAIENFYNIHGHLPCPASRTQVVDNSKVDDGNYGETADCSAADDDTGTVSDSGLRTGVVPIRALNLPNMMIGDEWGNRFTYIVTEDLAQTAALYTASDGAIAIQDAGTNSLISPAGQGAYVLFSAGDDKKGAYIARTGVLAANCGATANIQDENCEGDGGGTRDSVYVDEQYAVGSTIVAAYFDDIVLWRTKQNFAERE